MGVMMVHGGDQRQEEEGAVVVGEPFSTVCRRSGHRLCSECWRGGGPGASGADLRSIRRLSSEAFANC